MDRIVGVLGGVSPSSFQFNNDDDSTDKLSHRYTTALLVIFAVVVSTKQYVGDPISCWVPAEFTGNWEEYTNSYCWIKNTYYLPFEDNIPKAHEEKEYSITYYQWVPLILLTQALFFYMPRILWRSLNNKCAIDVDNIVEQAESFERTDTPENKDKTMDLMIKQLDRFLMSRDHYHASCTLSFTDCVSRMCCPVCGRKSGNYLTLIYLVVKLVYIGNVIGQIFLMDAFLGANYHMYGIDVVSALIKGADWSDSPRFPRVTMCDFQVRRLGNLQRYTVQCVLTINLFNEMIYLFIWFWLVFVAAMACLSFLRWALRMLSATDRKRFVKKHLTLMEEYNADRDQDLLKDFCEEYMKSDGIFILRMVGHNADAVTVTEFTVQLWSKYRLKRLGDLEPTENPPPPTAPSANNN